jgi:hypothetical protein
MNGLLSAAWLPRYTRPMALRPCLTAGLPLSGTVGSIPVAGPPKQSRRGLLPRTSPTDLPKHHFIRGANSVRASRSLAVFFRENVEEGQLIVRSAAPPGRRTSPATPGLSLPVLLALYVVTRPEEAVQAQPAQQHVLLWSSVENVVASLTPEPVPSGVAVGHDVSTLRRGVRGRSSTTPGVGPASARRTSSPRRRGPQVLVRSRIRSARLPA